MKKTLLVNVTTIFKPIRGEGYVSGMGRSTYQLLNAISKQGELPFDIRLYGSGLSAFHNNADGLPFKYNCFPLPMKLGSELTRLESFFVNNVYKHDLLHIPHNYDYSLSKGMDFVVTIHDVCEYDDAVKRGNTKRVMAWRNSAEYSKKILTCSQCSKNDIVNRFRLPDEKVVVIPWGIDLGMFRKFDDDDIYRTLERFGVVNSYFLAVSCSNERKNMSNLMKAFRCFINAGGKSLLVLLWGNPPQQILNEYEKEIRAKKMIFLNYVSDNDLVALYGGALATMYPSRYEGFGFPILESFACGTPVMTCRNSSLVEVGGAHAVYVGEDDVDEMVQAMQMFENGQFDYEVFRGAVKKYVGGFSWDKTANKYIEFYSNNM